MNPRIFLNNVAWALHWHPAFDDDVERLMFSADRVPGSSPGNESWPAVLFVDGREIHGCASFVRPRVRRPSP